MGPYTGLAILILVVKESQHHANGCAVCLPVCIGTVPYHKIGIAEVHLDINKNNELTTVTAFCGGSMV